VLVYRAAITADAQDRASVSERGFAQNDWRNSWRNGVYSFAHYHSTAHEALGVYSGSARLRLGGEHGQTVEVRSGDVILIPAGVAHHNIGASPDFSVVGAYPDGLQWGSASWFARRTAKIRSHYRSSANSRLRSDLRRRRSTAADLEIRGVTQPSWLLHPCGVVAAGLVCSSAKGAVFNLSLGQRPRVHRSRKQPSAEGALHLSRELHRCARLKRAYSACSTTVTFPGAMPQALP
jgi:uncharacterized protein YjlB